MQRVLPPSTASLSFAHGSGSSAPVPRPVPCRVGKAPVNRGSRHGRVGCWQPLATLFLPFPSLPSPGANAVIQPLSFSPRSQFPCGAGTRQGGASGHTLPVRTGTGLTAPTATPSGPQNALMQAGGSSHPATPTFMGGCKLHPPIQEQDDASPRSNVTVLHSKTIIRSCISHPKDPYGVGHAALQPPVRPPLPHLTASPAE